MPAYLHPGVYIEEIPSGSKPIEAVGTSTAAFVGFTTKGPLNEPTLISSFDDYERLYGGIRDLVDAAGKGDPMGFSVAAFFLNGGTKAYIVRMAKTAAKASGYVRDPTPTSANALLFTAVNEGVWANDLIVRVEENLSVTESYKVEIGRYDEKGELIPLEEFSGVSLDAEASGFIEGVLNGVSEYVTVKLRAEPDTAPPEYTENLTGTITSGNLGEVALTFSSPEDGTLDLTLDATLVTVILTTDFANLEALANEIQTQVRAATGGPEVDEFTAEVVGTSLVLTSGSRGLGSSVTVAVTTAAEALKLAGNNGETVSTAEDSLNDLLNGKDARLVAGLDGQDVKSVEEGDTILGYSDIFTQFLKIRDINVLCLPGHTYHSSDDKTIIDAAIAHAEATKSRMVIVDPPTGTNSELKKETDVTRLGLPTKTYGVLYYPWVKVANPFYDDENRPGVPATLRIPPCGYAAGMWSRIDGRRGVWKAPAGVETQLLGLAGLEHMVEDAEQDFLNPLGVNALRTLPGFGRVVWGSRTLATKADPEWRYVPVRRTAIFIEQSIYNGIQWAVFEPNSHLLWSSLRVNVESFMDGLFRSGAFQGEKASDAYFVRCGLGDTMTQADIDRGQVIVIVGFAPLKPAEFVIVRIQQKVAQQ